MTADRQDSLLYNKPGFLVSSLVLVSDLTYNRGLFKHQVTAVFNRICQSQVKFFINAVKSHCLPAKEEIGEAK